MKRKLLIVLGSFFVGLGILGIFLPLLPTTPFLLLAAACYIRSSKKFYTWLTKNRWFGKYIRDYQEGRGIPLKVKLFSITLLWLTIGISIVFVVHLLVIRLILAAIALGVTLHIISIKRRKGRRT
jgi:uncharacterized membrane protein YbaN (DUF454 family)